LTCISLIASINCEGWYLYVLNVSVILMSMWVMYVTYKELSRFLNYINYWLRGTEFG